MKDSWRKEVNTFTDYFRDQLVEITTLTTKHQELYRKLLYVSVLDTLAGSVFPKRKNRDRFTAFVERFCEWPDGARVSLPHLMQLLKRNPDPVFQKLREWTIARYKALPAHDGGIPPISHDPLFEEVKRAWPASADHRMPLEGIDLSSLTHYQLLYVYRNMLVHEFRSPGRGIEFRGEDNEPFYHGMTSTNDAGAVIGRTVELVYPELFLHRLCEAGLKNVKEYFISNELSPLESFVFGTYWIRELNR